MLTDQNHKKSYTKITKEPVNNMLNNDISEMMKI